MILRALVAGLAAATAAPTGAQAQTREGWAKTSTAHFDLLSDGGAVEARAATAALARFRRLLQGLLPPRRPDPEGPLVVLAFRGEDSFLPYVPRQDGDPRAVDGFFQGGTARTFIAVNLGAEGADRYDALYHEYAHLALNRALAAQPAWVAEGLAELYAAWEPGVAEARVGLPRPHHLRLLRERGLLPLDELLRADYTSDLYVSAGRSPHFYAQSWLLAHYLMLSRPGGRNQLERYLAEVAQGRDSRTAFRDALGEDPASIVPRLRTYLLSASLPVARVPQAEDGPTERAEPAPDATVTPSSAEVDYLLADVLLHQDRARDARGHLSRALAADPGFRPAREAMAQVALKEARWDEARAQLRAAREGEPDSPAALYRYADTLVSEASQRGLVLSDEDSAAAVAALEQAVARAPHFADAAHLLARLRPQPARRRIALLEPIFTREPQRTDLGLTLANLYVRVDELEAAAGVLARARAAARDEDQRFLAGHMLARIGFASSQTGQVTGTLVRLECLAEGALDFVVEASHARLTLRTAGPQAVMLYGPDGEPLETELVCGPQNAPVTAWYRRAPAGERAEGTLLSLTWRIPAAP